MDSKFKNVGIPITTPTTTTRTGSSTSPDVSTPSSTTGRGSRPSYAVGSQPQYRLSRKRKTSSRTVSSIKQSNGIAVVIISVSTNQTPAGTTCTPTTPSISTTPSTPCHHHPIGRIRSSLPHIRRSPSRTPITIHRDSSSIVANIGHDARRGTADVNAVSIRGCRYEKSINPSTLSANGATGTR